MIRFKEGVDDCLIKTNGSDKDILNILFMQWIMFGMLISNSPK